MTDQEELQLIIETALNHGWQGADTTSFGVDEKDFPAIAARVTQLIEPKQLPTLLYGDNLSLLRAACGEKEIQVFWEILNDVDTKMSLPAYQIIASVSVLKPEAERLSLICEHLRKDKP